MKKTFWDRTAKIYDRFMQKAHKAYKQMYSLIYPVVRHRQVLELATKLHFSVQDMFCLPYADHSFDVVSVSNALHIVPELEKALAEIRRVLKDGGVFCGCFYVKGIAWFVCRKGETL